jgi:hypothetical protein
VSYYVRCLNPRCREIFRSEDLSYDDGIFMMKGFCRECGEQVEDVEGVCDECEKALAEPDDDYCAACRDAMDERDFELDLIAAKIEIPSKERRHRDLMDTIASIARGAQTPEEIEL